MSTKPWIRPEEGMAVSYTHLPSILAGPSGWTARKGRERCSLFIFLLYESRTIRYNREYSLREKEGMTKMADPIVTIEMENGDIMKAELYPQIAPNTVCLLYTSRCV